MTTVEVLRAARSLVEGGWTQRAYAETLLGRPCDAADPDAVRFCAVGAFVRVQSRGEAGPDDIDDAFDHLLDATGAEDVAGWNDAPDRTQAEVLAAYDQAIALAAADPE